jgi:N-acetylglucosaminyl-diphospho-decaprenol L-rhamnosyltransferase
MGKPTISVCVVLFHTAPELVDQCLASIKTSAEVVPGEVEIVVVDNSSDESLRATFGDRVTTWIHSGANLGFATASNRAFRASTGSHVMFLNPDASLTPSGMARLLETSGAHPSDLIGGWLLKNGRVQVDGLMHWWTSSGRLIKRRRYRRYLESAVADVVEVEKVSGGAMLAERRMLEALGPFDERFFLYGEDADLSQRVKREGGNLFAVRSAEVQHVGASSQESHSSLVERARTDAAIRLASYHLPLAQSLASRLDLLLITVIGLVPGLGRSSGSKQGRLARLSELRRWGLRRDMPRFSPESLK